MSARGSAPSPNAVKDFWQTTKNQIVEITCFPKVFKNEVAEGRKPSGFAAPDGLRRTAKASGS